MVNKLNTSARGQRTQGFKLFHDLFLEIYDCFMTKFPKKVYIRPKAYKYDPFNHTYPLAVAHATSW